MTVGSRAHRKTKKRNSVQGKYLQILQECDTLKYINYYIYVFTSHAACVKSYPKSSRSCCNFSLQRYEDCNLSSDPTNPLFPMKRPSKNLNSITTSHLYHTASLKAALIIFASSAICSLVRIPGALADKSRSCFCSCNANGIRKLRTP